MSLVTYAIPSYNHARFLPQLLTSLLGQTHRNIEVIICDDGSEDNSVAVARDFAARDSRIQVYEYSNGGITANRNRCLARAMGEFISYIDSDDFVPLDRTVTLLEALKANPRAILAYGDALLTYDGSSHSVKFSKVYPQPHTQDLTKRLFMNYCYIPSVSVMYRTKYLNESGIFIGPGIHTDYIKLIQLSLAGPFCECSGKILGYWRQHSLNTSQTSVGGVVHFYQTQREALSQLYQSNTLLQSRITAKELNARLARSHLMAAFWLITKAQFVEAIREVHSSELLSPRLLNKLLLIGYRLGLMRMVRYFARLLAYLWFKK